LVPSENDRSPESVVASAMFSALTETVWSAVPTVSVTLTLRFSPPPRAMVDAA
jgi:hypothetical protein